MANAWKYVKWTVIGITGLFLALVVFLFLWIDPNDYRDDVSKLVKDKTGLVLAIKGNIGWAFYPAIGFSVEGLSLATGEGEAPLAAVNKAAVSVELLPLFSRQVNVRTLYIDGVTATLVVDENGKGNWEALAGQDKTEPEPAADSGGADLKVSVPKVMVTNTVVDYTDRKANTHHTVTVKELVAENVALGSEFPLHLVAALDDHKGLKADVDTRAFVTLNPDAKLYTVRALDLKANAAGILAQPLAVTLGADIAADLGAQRFQVRNLALNADVAGIFAQPFKATVTGEILADMAVRRIDITSLLVNATNVVLVKNPVTLKAQGPVSVDLAADTATVGPLQFSAASLGGTLAVNVKDLTKELSYGGTLETGTFNAKQLMREFGITPPNTTDPVAMTKVALKTAFEGALTRAMLNDLAITLDDTRVTGSAGITDVATTALVFNLAVDAINADRYLPPPARPATDGKAPAAAPAPVATTAAGKPAPLLPVETLRTLNIDGKLKAGKVTFMEWPMTSLAVGVQAKDGNVRIDPVSAGVLEGTVKGDVQIDARGAEPRIISHLRLDKVEVGGIVKRYAGRDLFLGKTSLNLAMDATGNDVDTLLRKAIGNIDVKFTDATLRGTNINNLLTESLTQQLGAFSMLVPDYQQKLPKELTGDTLFSALAGGATLKDGIAQVPAFNAGLKDGSVKGGGQFNLVTRDFDYTIAMKTTKLKDNKYFANAEFPLRCKGNLTGAPADWCRPDSKAIGDMLKKAAENAAKDRLKGELAGKLGVESVDSKALKAEADKQLEAQKKQAEQKAKEKAGEELNKALKKFF